MNYLQFKDWLKSKVYRKPVIWPMLERGQSVLYRWNHLRYYQSRRANLRLSLHELHIEFASNCNLRCKFCALDHDKPKQHITEDVLRKVFDQLRDDTRFHKIKRIHLHNGGEILAHPKRVDMLAVIGEYKKANAAAGIPFPEIHMLTNGMLMRERIAKEILDLGVVDEVGWSMDGGSPEDYESMRLLAKWDKFSDNLKTFHQINAESRYPVKTFAITCVPDDKPLGTAWMEPSFRHAVESVDRLEVRRLHNWGGAIDELVSPPKSHKIGCDLLMQQMVILPNGDVTVCCTDLNSQGVIGNVLEQSLFDIYFGPARREYLDKLRDGRKDELELCKDCESF